MRCPVCKAVVEQGPQCRRCRADLSLLLDVENQTVESRTIAARLAAAGKLDDAVRLAENAAAVHRNEESQRLIAVLHLLRRDCAAAFREYQRLRQTQT
jgi:hypothetical protein